MTDSTVQEEPQRQVPVKDAQADPTVALPDGSYVLTAPGPWQGWIVRPPPSGPAQTPPPTPPQEQPPEEEDEEFDPNPLAFLIETLAANAQGISTLMQAFGEQGESKRKDARRRMYVISGMFFAFMSVIVVGSGLLVYAGALDGNAFSFLIAVVVGSMITFVGSAVFGQMKQ